MGAIPTHVNGIIEGGLARKILPGDAITIAGVPIPHMRMGFGAFGLKNNNNNRALFLPIPRFGGGTL